MAKEKSPELEKLLTPDAATDETFVVGGVTFHLRKVPLDTFLGLDKQIRARMTLHKANPIQWDGRDVEMSQNLAALAVQIEMGVKSPEISFIDAVKLLMKFGGKGIELADAITRLSGFAPADEQIDQAVEDLRNDPPATS